MLEQQDFAALLGKVAVAASIASIMMRFARIQRLLLKDDRTVAERLLLALIFSVIFGSGAELRIQFDSYQAVDLAMEGSIIAGMLGGYVTGLVTGICVSIPDMFFGKYMSMPLFAAAGVIGGLMRDLAPQKEDVWYFSPFVDLNLYRVVRQLWRAKKIAIQRPVLERAAFNLACNFIVILTESLRLGIHRQFKEHDTFFLIRTWTSPWNFAFVAAATLFSVSLPIRVWSSFRTEKQLEAQRVRLTEARLAALTNQINPHFLFNTLNSVATLIRVNPDEARRMIYKLSNILRRLLRKTENSSPLREEISFIDDYLAIEMVRFGDKLRFHKQIEDSTLDRLVPSMVLQPIIENSIKHGLASKVDGGTIRLKAWLVGARLHVQVEDDGVGIPPAKLERLFEQGIGVSNVNERLKVLFGHNYRLLVESEPGAGTKTLIEIPEMEAPLLATQAS